MMGTWRGLTILFLLMFPSPYFYMRRSFRPDWVPSRPPSLPPSFPPSLPPSLPPSHCTAVWKPQAAICVIFTPFSASSFLGKYWCSAASPIPHTPFSRSPEGQGRRKWREEVET